MWFFFFQDQNPAYYELLQEAAFKTEPEPNITTWLIARAHRRYGLAAAADTDVVEAWADIARSGYSNNAPVLDSTLVGTIFASDWVVPVEHTHYIKSKWREIWIPYAQGCDLS